jgi:uncharacterized protein
MKILYLHGFASGPYSAKGVTFARHFATKGIAIERMNVRVPSFEHLRLSVMIDTVRAALGERAIVIGSSLGGLTAARVAEVDDRVKGIVLLAPAFQILARWRESLGAEWDAWRERGWREVDDYGTGDKSRIDFGFAEDVERIDIGYPEVRVPTLIFHGRNDDAVPIERSRTFAAGKANVELLELDDDHELHASLPIMIAKTETFLARFGLPV